VDAETLVRLAARGDETAFRAIWTEHRDAVYRFAYWMLQETAAAEDVAQECFLALLEHPARFEQARGSLRTFLLAIAQNRCRKIWRHLPEVGLNEDDLACQLDVVRELEASDSRAIVNAAISQLPPLQREAVYLFEYEELSLDEAAAVAGTDVTTFKSRLYRGRQHLKRQLGWLVKRGL
jgi:RNA polymerase sigma-70 factor (ECF subfamily)